MREQNYCFLIIIASGKQNYTVLFCGNAAALVLPPYVIYKSANLYDEWCNGGPSGTRYNATASGSMECNIFVDWLVNHFIPGTKHINGPKVLILDGHVSHVSIKVITECQKANVHLVCLPPHSSHVLQPLDVGVFGPLKQSWRGILNAYYMESRYKNLSKEAFPKLLLKLHKSIKPHNLIKSFMACGIYPPDATQIKREKPALVLYLERKNP